MTRLASNPRRFFAPEVVQSSAMDCGPAALSCLLRGFGISASYGRLREACQTDVDGTSIDTLEEVAVQLGLEAEQVMVPVDHLLLDEAGSLPALVVATLPGGTTHFVVAWRRHGPLVQVMDPAVGRCWKSCAQFLETVYVHSKDVPATAWREWAGSEGFLAALRARLARLGLANSVITRVTGAALADEGWRFMATLDAATRMIDSIVRAGGLARGAQAGRAIEALVARARQGPADNVIPEPYWSVRQDERGQEEQGLLRMRGAVLVQVRGRRIPGGAAAEQPSREAGAQPSPLPLDLAAALSEPPNRPTRDLLLMLRADGLFVPSILIAALCLAAGSVVVEALLFRGFLDLWRELPLSGQRLVAMAALFAFIAALMVLELPLTTSILRLGRGLEVRLRVAFLDKIPRLGDRYFASRLTSDMAERGHSVHEIRSLPILGSQLIRSIFEILFTAVGIAWLDPVSAPLAVLAATASVILPLLAQPVLTEQDLRVRTHSGALGRFYLDALLGIVAVRAHGAERSLRREHEGLLVEWARAGMRLQRSVVLIEGLQLITGFSLASWMLFGYFSRGGDLAAALLLVYWALNLPVLGEKVSISMRQYPTQRSVTLRLLEPLGAREEEPKEEPALAVEPGADSQEAGNPSGAAIRLEGVGVRIAGHVVLDGVDLDLSPGSRIAVVGPSGAGKSSLVGLLLGWHRAAAGRVVVDGHPLNGRRLERLRLETVWVDSSVQLWNRSLLDNLRYGAPADSTARLGRVIEASGLRGVVEQLHDGMTAPLGEGGALVSGGEGQRVRLGRGMLRPAARLVILDEPFRGLPRGQRRQLLECVNGWWPHATLLFISHDVSDTLAFDRIIVMHGGRVQEEGAPSVLAAQPASRYRALLDAEVKRDGLWSSQIWRRLDLTGGRLSGGAGTMGST